MTLTKQMLLKGAETQEDPKQNPEELNSLPQKEGAESSYSNVFIKHI